MKRLGIPALLLLAAVLAGCGSDEEEPATEGPGLVQRETPGHVHAVGVDPKDGAIVLAAHNGMYRAEPDAARAQRLGDERRDVMGFTIEGPGRYAGSGHPDPQAGGPSSVGFIRSTDAGRTWRTVALEGRVDLHALEVAGDRVYGFDAISGSFLSSADGGRRFARSAIPPVLDLAVDPSSPTTVIASTEDGILRSTDAGRTWRPTVRTAPSLLLWDDAGVVLIGLDGSVRASDGPADAGAVVGRLPGPAAAATLHEGELLVAQDDGSVLSSKNRGRSWTVRLTAA